MLGLRTENCQTNQHRSATLLSRKGTAVCRLYKQHITTRMEKCITTFCLLTGALATICKVICHCVCVCNVQYSVWPRVPQYNQIFEEYGLKWLLYLYRQCNFRI